MSEREEQKEAPIDPRVANDFVQRLKTSKPGAEPMTRRLETVKGADLGSQSIGVAQPYSIALPKVADPSSGQAQIGTMLHTTNEIYDSMSGVPAMYSANFGDAMRNYAVYFAPKTRGEFSTVLDLTARWSDGHVEQTTIPIRGRGYALTDPRYEPEPAKPELTSSLTAADETDSDPNKAVPYGFYKGDQALQRSLGAAFDDAHDAVDDVEKAEGKYQAPEPPVPLWVHFAQVALEVGLSLLSESLGEIGGKALGKALGKAISVEEEEIIKRFSTALSKTIESGVKETKITELDGGPVKPPPKVEALDQGSNALLDRKAVLVSKKETSSHPSIPFFSAQKKKINQVKKTTLKQMTGHFISLAEGANNVAGVTAAMTQTEEMVDSRASEFATRQADASTVNWMKALAQAELGTSSAPSDADSTTMLVDVRNDMRQHGGKNARGLLEIVLKKVGRKFQVDHVKLAGMSRESAERVLELNLREARVPIAIRLWSGKTITVDEAGRVRSNGAAIENQTPFEYGTLDSTEALDDHDYTQLVNELLEVPLKEQGVAEIETDDARKE